MRGAALARWFEYIRRALNDHETAFGQRTDIALQVVILISLVSLTVDSIDGQPTWTYSVFFVVEVLSMGVFTIEYGLRIATARPMRSYVFSFWGIIDFLAVVPYYLFAESQWVRALRFLRIFRLLEHNKAVARFSKAFAEAKNELLVFGSAATIMLFVAAAGIYQFEHVAQPETFSSIPESLWWAIVTLTTVGYGDVYPVTLGGRIFTGFIMVVGLGVVAGLTGVVASALSRVRGAE